MGSRLGGWLWKCIFKLELESALLHHIGQLKESCEVPPAPSDAVFAGTAPLLHHPEIVIAGPPRAGGFMPRNDYCVERIIGEGGLSTGLMIHEMNTMWGEWRCEPLLPGAPIARAHAHALC